MVTAVVVATMVVVLLAQVVGAIAPEVSVVGVLLVEVVLVAGIGSGIRSGRSIDGGCGGVSDTVEGSDECYWQCYWCRCR